MVMFNSCGNEPILFIADPYWFSAGYTPSHSAKNGADGSYRTVSLEGTEISTETVKTIAQAHRGKTLVLSPLLSAGFRETAGGHQFEDPADLVLLNFEGEMGQDPVSWAESGVSLRNFTLVRTGAFRELGIEFGTYLLDHENAAVRGQWYTGTAPRKGEYNSFISGMGEIIGENSLEDRLDIVEIADLDLQAVKDYVQQFENDPAEGNIGVSFVSLYNEYCINKFVDTGMGFASEYLDPGGYSVTGPVFSVRYSISSIAEGVLEDSGSRGMEKKVEAVLIKTE